MAQRYKERYPALFSRSDQVSFFKEESTLPLKTAYDALLWRKTAMISTVVELGVAAAVVGGLIKMQSSS